MTTMNNNSTNQDKRLKIDYPAMIYQRSHSLHHNIKNLIKFFLENSNSTSTNNKLQEEMEAERNEKVQYSILDDLKQICYDINNTNFLPDYTVKLIITPRYKKENDDVYWR